MTLENELSEILGAVYDSVLDERLWSKSLEKIAGFVGGSSALLFHQDRAARSGDSLYSWNADPAWTKLYFEKYVGLNPVMPFTVFMDVGSVAAFSRLIDIEEFKSSQFYIEWAKPQQYLDVVVSILDKSAAAMGMLGVTRLDHEGLAGDENIRRMELVAPHVSRAVKISRMFASLQTRAGLFSEMIEALGDAVFILDQAGRVLFANAAAKVIVDGSSALPIVAGLLSPQDPKASRDLRLALKSAARGDVTDKSFARDLLIAQNGNERLQGHLLPLLVGNRQANGFSGAVAALFVRAVGPDQKPPMEALAQLYDFTPRELQVFIAVMNSGSVPDAAKLFGISATTVRTHLQSIFDKTGARSQADVAGLAASLLPPMGTAR